MRRDLDRSRCDAAGYLRPAIYDFKPMERVSSSWIRAQAHAVSRGIIKRAIHQLVPLRESVRCLIEDLHRVVAVMKDAVAHEHATLVSDHERHLAGFGLDRNTIDAAGD